MADQKQDMTDVLNKIKAVAQSGNLTSESEEHKASYEAFIDKLIEERSFPDISPEVKTELKRDLVGRLDSFIAAKVIAALSDKDVLLYEKMLRDNRPAEELQKFTVEHIADFVNFLTNTLLEFRGVYLGLISVPVSLDVNLAEAIKREKITRSMPPAPVTSDNANAKVIN